MILITGVTGTVGKAVLTEVARGGTKRRAMYRSAGEAANARPETEAVVADFADRASLAKALKDVDSLFLVCSPIPQLVELESNVIEASEAAGVRRIVLSSALGAGDYPKSFPGWHRKVEDKLRATKMASCILRPNSFFQNIVAFYAPTIRTQGAFYSSVGDAGLSYIDFRDVGTVAAKALAGGHDGHVYELNGPEALTNSEIAAKITAATGVTAKYVNIPVDAQRASMLGQGMPEWQVTALLDLQAYYTGGQGGDMDATLAQLLGRPPITADQFLREFAGAFRA